MTMQSALQVLSAETPTSWQRPSVPRTTNQTQDGILAVFVHGMYRNPNTVHWENDLTPSLQPILGSTIKNMVICEGLFLGTPGVVIRSLIAGTKSLPERNSQRRVRRQKLLAGR